jgi:hypothetical protein
MTRERPGPRRSRTRSEKALLIALLHFPHLRAAQRRPAHRGVIGSRGPRGSVDAQLSNGGLLGARNVRGQTVALASRVVGRGCGWSVWVRVAIDR